MNEAVASKALMTLNITEIHFFITTNPRDRLQCPQRFSAAFEDRQRIRRTIFKKYKHATNTDGIGS